MKTKAIALVVATLMLSFAALNVEAVQIRGARSCGVWTKDKDTANGSTNTTWLLGFLSAWAIRTEKDFLNGTDNESIELWVDNYCRANPLDTIANAGAALANELIQKKGLRR